MAAPASSHASSTGSGAAAAVDEEEEELAPVFTTEEEAAAARKVALDLFNTAHFAAALPFQVGILRFATSKYGELDPRCGLPYLDYGLTLLSLLQSQDAEAAMIAGDANEEDLETCFMNLDAARVCFEKAEAKAPHDADIQLRLAEVHDALAQLLLEQDHTDGAVAEFEHVLMTLRALPEKRPGRVVGTLFSIGCALMDAQDYDGAVKRFEETLKEASDAPENAVGPELRAEIEHYLAEARELQSKPHQMVAVKDEIRELFPDEASQVPDPEEFEKQQKPTSQFVVPMPADFSSGPSKSVPLSLMTPIAPEDGHSNSISMFPRQSLGGGGGGSNSNSRRAATGAAATAATINTNVPVKKKEKPVAAAGGLLPPSSAGAADERAVKAARAE